MTNGTIINAIFAGLPNGTFTMEEIREVSEAVTARKFGTIAGRVTIMGNNARKEGREAATFGMCTRAEVAARKASACEIIVSMLRAMREEVA